MKRLILFSGGVESTAMLAAANPTTDQILTVLPTYPAGIPTFDEIRVQQIAHFYKFTPVFAQIRMPVEPVPYNFVHQLHTFFSIAHLWCEKDQQIQEVWYGLNSTDLTPVNEPTYKKIMTAWNFLHPSVRFKFPLSGYSKQQQWEMIDDTVKPLVSTCIINTNCGECSKCKEFSTLVNTV